MSNGGGEAGTLGTVREILRYGGSTFAALVAVSVYTMTDMYFIGNYVGQDGLGAMALAYPVTLIFTALGTLVEIGGSAVVSELFGKGRRDEAEAAMRGSYLYVAAIAVFLAAVGHLVIGPVLVFLSSDPSEQHIIGHAESYLTVVLWGVPFLLAMTLTQAFMRCIEKPNHVFLLIVAAAMTNVALDALFVAGLGMGMQGAATATLLSEVLGAGLSFWYFAFSPQKFKTPRKFCGPSVILREARIGGGFAIAEMATCATEFLQNGVILAYDATELLAAASISNVILSFAYLPLAGLDTGTQPLVSRLFAEGSIKRCMAVCRTSFCLTMALTVAIYIILMVFPRELGDFFLPKGAELREDMILFLRYSFLLQPCVGLSTWMGGVMAALEDEWRNIVANTVSVAVQMLSIWLLPKFLPTEAVALNYSIADVVMALAGFLLIGPFLRGRGLSLGGIFKGQPAH